jgi:GNAT superfamily N-acetyltransferase
MIGTVSIAELPEVAGLIRRVVLQSVDANDQEKAAFLENIQKNLVWCQDHAQLAVHLKFCAGAAIVGVVLVKNYWNLCHLFVEPSWQRRGVGTSLIHEAIAQCRGKAPQSAIRLNSSRNAVSFYEALGFVRVQDAPAPYTGMQFEYVL